MISLQGITKRYPNRTALDNISCQFGDDRIVGLFGRNGAGKTTLMNIITNRIFPTAGTITVDGIDHRTPEALRNVYLMTEQDLLPKDIRIKTLFKWTADFYPSFDMAYARLLADDFNLDLKQTLNRLSTGYRTIAKNIIALATHAGYTFFDEPVLGLDAAHRALFYQKCIESYSARPRTMMLSTHLIEEAASLVEHVYFLHDGHLVVDSDTEALLENAVTIRGSTNDLAPLQNHPDCLKSTALGGLVTLFFLKQPHHIPPTATTHPMDLEQIFLLITGTTSPIQ